MSKVVYLKKKFNHRWRENPLYTKGFDYDDPKYADVPDGLKWALPIHEAVSAPAEKARAARMIEEAERCVDTELRKKAIRLCSQKP